MIQKVSDQERMEWVEQNGSTVRREGISKRAVDSFAAILLKEAKTMKAKGNTVEQIAAKFNLSVDTMKSLFAGHFQDEPVRKTASCDDCERDAQVKEKEAHLTDAEAAYYNLRGEKASLPPAPAFSKRVFGSSVSDISGPHKQMGMENSPSIFDVDVLDRAMKTPDNGERIREANAKEAQRREDILNASRYTTIDGQALKEALATTDQRKDNGVHSLSAPEAHKYGKKIPSRGMSIFDGGDFDNIEKTAGEKLTEKLKKEAEAPKKRTWVEDSNKKTSSSAIFDKMIESLLKENK